eukprot:gb/GECH01010807.1/.p1 GENE.gb/GECH01010807.1/~~gb/GECH01010807.1/.p1  ORF type:complete len:191 (+),score=27.45 gb/GECH01010807.1/:1-573(+)
MVEWCNRSHVYDHPWERVTFAHWRKYPNPNCPHVLDVDVTNRHLDPEGKLHSTRIMTCKQAIPDWVMKVVGSSQAYVLEQTEVDPKQKVMTLKSKNLSFPNLISVQETCTYRPDPADHMRTLFQQKAKIEVQVPPMFLARKAEGMTLSTFHQKAKTGLDVVESLCDKIKTETLDTINSMSHENRADHSSS